MRDHDDAAWRRLLRSLPGSHIARVGVRTQGDGAPPSDPRPGRRRVWSDSRGRISVSEWNAGKLGMYDPVGRRWREWRLPGANPQPYAVYVDERDVVWLSDFNANALVRFDPRTRRFTRVTLPSSPANVRQILGRQGEVWARSQASTSSWSCG